MCWKVCKKNNIFFANSGSAFLTNTFTFKVSNSSSKYTIKAIHLKGYYKCIDESKCKTQYFDETRYVSISPGEES